jgi:hypothetical protein
MSIKNIITFINKYKKIINLLYLALILFVLIYFIVPFFNKKEKFNDINDSLCFCSMYVDGEEDKLPADWQKTHDMIMQNNIKSGKGMRVTYADVVIKFEPADNPTKYTTTLTTNDPYLMEAINGSTHSETVDDIIQVSMLLFMRQFTTFSAFKLSINNRETSNNVKSAVESNSSDILESNEPISEYNSESFSYDNIMNDIKNN